MSRRLLPVSIFSLALLATSLGMGGTAIAADEPRYFLPAPADTLLTVEQGNAQRDFRSNEERYAFDFAPSGDAARFPVVAARGGTVIGARSSVRGGRCQEPGDERRPECWRDVNFVLIDHGDGSSGLYLHLRPGSLPARVGEVVTTGQPIGTAGNTGWTEGTGVQFQVQPTPPWSDRGRGGWFMTESEPVAFSDPDVLTQWPDGVPESGGSVTSGNPGPTREPFRFARRPTGLAATVPFEIDREREVTSAYDADSPDGYGLHFAPAVDAPVASPVTAASPGPALVPGSPAAASLGPAASLAPTVTDPGTTDPGTTDPGTIVRPIFGGELAFAGCATGTSASLGRMVAISLELDEDVYTAVLGHLSEIEPSLLDLDPAVPAPILGPNEFLGRYGVILAPGEEPALSCPEADASDPAASDPAADELFAAILRDAVVTPEGEIVGGTPVSPEPLVGGLAYEGFDWWAGPLAAVAIAEEPGRPRARWNQRTLAHASHVTFGEPIRLVARVRDVTDMTQVRFRAYYPAWPRSGSSADLESFDPRTAWRQLASCLPPRGRAQDPDSECRWNGDAQDAVVTFDWDPSAAPPAPTAPWLPRERAAMTRASTACLPVSLAVEVVDAAGLVYSEIGRLPVPSACDERRVDRSRTGRVLYLDPLVPPRAPASRGEVEDRGWPPVFEPDPLDGAIVWRDRSDNEDGFNIYARRSYLRADCSIRHTAWQEVTDLPEDTQRYRPEHARVARSIEVPDIPDVPGALDRWEYAVTAFNEAGETDRVRVGGFVRGSEAFCDQGLEPPPDL